MHAKQLVELAALVATRSPTIVHGTIRLPVRDVEEYWAASKCRLQHWATGIFEFNREAKWSSQPQRTLLWRRTEPLFVEILLADILSRVWGTVLLSLDQYSGRCDYGPIARSVQLGHLEARNRLLKISQSELWNFVPRRNGVEQQGDSMTHGLEKHIRQSERWTDMSLAVIECETPIYEFGFDSDRIAVFSRGGLNDVVASMFQLGVRDWLRRISVPAFKPNLNGRVGRSVLSCLTRPLFHETGQLASAWQVRLTQASDDMASLLDSLSETQVPSTNLWDDRI